MADNVYTGFMKFIFVAIIIFLILIFTVPLILPFLSGLGLTLDGFIASILLIFLGIIILVGLILAGFFGSLMRK